MAEKTLESRLPPAEVCRQNGWTVGTILEGEEYGKTARITITAIGRENIMAIDHGDGGYEGGWVLNCRDWKKIGQETGA